MPAAPFRGIPAALFLAALSPAGFAQADAFPGWAFPWPQSINAPATWDDRTPLSVPGSLEHFTEAQLHKRSVPPDWYPAEHSPAPAIVAGREGGPGYACGFCHLPNGGGRPENAKLAGLPASYIQSQVSAFKSRERRPDQSDWRATRLMAEAVSDLSPNEIALAAAYFSRQTAISYVRIVETKTVPQHEVGIGVMMPLPGKPAPIGNRIVELPADVDRFERRDPKVAYYAYVPKGSLARGRQLATKGGPDRLCAGCHGAGLKGDANLPGPPIAGRFPTYLFRQLYGFQSGARSGDATLPMQSVVAHLTQDDMIALASYVASLKP